MLNSICEETMASRPFGGVIYCGLRTAYSLYEKREMDNCKRWIFRETSCFTVRGMQA